jgi:hypothetical protein
MSFPSASFFGVCDGLIGGYLDLRKIRKVKEKTVCTAKPKVAGLSKTP